MSTRQRIQAGTDFAPPIHAVTWNVYAGTPADELRPIFRELVRDGVDLVLMQEAAGRDIDRMIEAIGWDTFTGTRPQPDGGQPSQYRLAWAPTRFDATHLDVERLSWSTYWSARKGHTAYSDAAVGVLRDKLAPGHVLNVMSYHTPAHVQGKGDRQRAPGRFRALVESARSWRRFAKGKRYVLIGGDDNVDEGRGFGSWRFLRRVATGLRQVQAPAPTHGKGRRIDDFRIKGLSVGRGYVRDGGGDHRLHGRVFRYQ